MPKLFTPDGEFTSLIDAIKAYRERISKQEAEEHRAALQAAQCDPEVQSWIALAENEEALRNVAKHVRPRKTTTTA
ncbi:hypothetical protein [Herpetosiphon giganteus]|uniref:hypothetical protein n=1 Tax=Herpetosiphon giganteus TaxID=2029754 RepID=UPI00195F1020|nr:hypothetical protein [Herpetosiphon giganteus]MBM7843795.1 hypothetical protein [Herpetosiphon giganteus]